MALAGSSHRPRSRLSVSSDDAAASSVRPLSLLGSTPLYRLLMLSLLLTLSAPAPAEPLALLPTRAFGLAQPLALAQASAQALALSRNFCLATDFAPVRVSFLLEFLSC